MGGRPRTAPEQQCHKHPGSQVRSIGTYTASTGVRRRYRCVPSGGARHDFSVAEGQQARVWTPPPACPQHPSGKVVRAGVYGTRTSRPRQRYRCTPPGEDAKAHVFTPPLPRDHVHAGDSGCAFCGELRGFHHGEQAVGRRQSWPVSIVARTLDDLARGTSYADASMRALRIAETDAEKAGAGRYRRKRRTKAEIEADRKEAADTASEQPPGDEPEPALEPGPDPGPVHTEAAAGEGALDAPVKRKGRRKSAASRAASNAWHIAADWVPAYGPVIWEPVEARLREAALAERARLDALRAAGELLVREAGGLVTDFTGRDIGVEHTSVVAGNPAVQAWLLGVVMNG